MSARLPDSARPAIDDARLNFIEEGERFAREHRDEAPFRYLRAFTGASEEELAQLMAKIYCDSRPERPGREESLAASFVKLLLQPVHFLISKKVAWSPETRVDFDFETIDQAHFDFWFKGVYDRVPGTKRLSPSHKAGPASWAAPLTSTVAPRTLLSLFAAPLWSVSLWLLSRRLGQNILASYRRALSLYAVFEGHFRRYPCRHFVTSADEQNHPSRYLGFRRNCPGRFVVVQNGERLYHPAFAFGMLDAYLAFGPYTAKLCRSLRVKAEAVVPVGSVILDRRGELLRKLSRSQEAARYDLLLMDQGLWPMSDLGEKISASFEKVFDNLDALKKTHPELRAAFQLRPYGDGAVREDVRRRARAHFTQDIGILDNENRGESYENMARTRLVLCFNSTIGYEAFFVGRGTRTLFVNCAGDPCQILSLDPRFQLYDPGASYEKFESAVLAALKLELPELPEIARERHLAPDGRVDERIAAHLLSLPPCS